MRRRLNEFIAALLSRSSVEAAARVGWYSPVTVISNRRFKLSNLNNSKIDVS
jgi:hypothetical protein